MTMREKYGLKPLKGVTTKSMWHESTPAEVEAAVETLRALPVKVTELTCRESQGWQVLSFRTLAGFVPKDTAGHDGGLILVTKSYDRFAALFAFLYGERERERRQGIAPRKPAGREKSTTVQKMRKNVEHPIRPLSRVAR